MVFPSRCDMWYTKMICDNFILDVWQGSDYASEIISFSKNTGLQPTTLLKDGLLHRHFSGILAT